MRKFLCERNRDFLAINFNAWLSLASGGISIAFRAFRAASATGWAWESINPGTTRLPPRSCGSPYFFAPSSPPTYANRPFFVKWLKNFGLIIQLDKIYDVLNKRDSNIIKLDIGLDYGVCIYDLIKEINNLLEHTQLNEIIYNKINELLEEYKMIIQTKDNKEIFNLLYSYLSSDSSKPYFDILKDNLKDEEKVMFESAKIYRKTNNLV